MGKLTESAAIPNPETILSTSDECSMSQPLHNPKPTTRNKKPTWTWPKILYRKGKPPQKPIDTIQKLRQSSRLEAWLNERGITNESGHENDIPSLYVASPFKPPLAAIDVEHRIEEFSNLIEKIQASDHPIRISQGFNKLAFAHSKMTSDSSSA